jgi:hypothetical protein
MISSRKINMVRAGWKTGRFKPTIKLLLSCYRESGRSRVFKKYFSEIQFKLTLFNL